MLFEFICWRGIILIEPVPTDHNIMQSQPDISPAATPYQPSPVETEQATLARSLPRDWSVCLLPVASLMLALSAYGVYALPTNFDLLVPLRILVLLCVALLAFIWLRTRGLLSSASNNVVTYKRDGTPTIWNPALPTVALFRLGIFFAGAGAFELWSIKLFSFDFASTLMLPSTFVAASTLLTFFASLLWLFRIHVLDNLLRNRFVNSWVLLPILVFSSWAYSGVVLPPSLHTTSFASWPSMIELVTHAAAQFDKDAVIADVTVGGPLLHGATAPTDPHDTALQMDFLFTTRGGHTILITVLDTKPPRITSLTFPSGWDSPRYDGSYSQAYLDALRAELAYVTIGPRDVYLDTHDEALAFTKGDQVIPDSKLALLLDTNWQKQYGTLAGWSILYEYPQAASSDKPPDNVYLSLYVDGDSGRVLAHDVTSDYPTWAWPGR